MLGNMINRLQLQPARKGAVCSSHWESWGAGWASCDPDAVLMFLNHEHNAVQSTR